MAATARLKGEVTLDDSKFHASVRRVSAAAAKVSGQLAKAFTGLAIAGITTGAVAATAAMAGLAAAIKRGLEVAGGFNDLSARIQDTAGNAALLAAAFDAGGVGGDQLGAVINKMQKALADANPALVRLGLNIEEVKRLAPTAQFIAIGNAIAAIKDPTAKAATAMEIFGKSGGQLLQVFGDGGGLETAKKALGSLPALLDQFTSRLDDVGDKTDLLSKKWDGFAVGIASGLLPILEPLLDKLISFDSASLGKGLGDDLAAAFGSQSIAAAMAELGGRFVKIMAAAAESIGDVIGAALTKAFEQPIADIQGRITAAVKNPLGAVQDALSKTPAGYVAGKASELIFGKSPDQVAGTEWEVGKNQYPRQAKEEAEDNMASGVRVGLGGGLTAEERMQRAFDRIKLAGAATFPQLTKAASGVGAGIAAPASKALTTPAPLAPGPNPLLAAIAANSATLSKLTDGTPNLQVMVRAADKRPSQQGFANSLNRDHVQGIISDISLTPKSLLDSGTGSLLSAPSRKVGGVRRRGESKEEFRARMDAQKAGNDKAAATVEPIKKTADAVTEMLSVVKSW